MCEQSCRRTGPRGCKADVGQGYSLEGVAVPSVVVPIGLGEVIGTPLLCWNQDPTNQVISNRFSSGHTHSNDYRGKSVLFAVPE